MLVIVVFLNIGYPLNLEAGPLVRLETSPGMAISPRILSGELLQVSDRFISLITDSVQFVLDRTRVNYIDFLFYPDDCGTISQGTLNDLDTIITKAGNSIDRTILDISPYRLQYLKASHPLQRQVILVSELSQVILSDGNIKFPF